MSHVNQKITAQFFLTANQPCPYLPDRQERKLFTTLRGPDARKMNDALSLRGFRRSQTVAYRPACANCGACLSVRVPVADFKPSRSQRRVLSRNADLDRRSCVAWATEEQFDLFRAYLSSRHTDGGMADMDICEFAAMVEETTVRTRVIEYHSGGNTGWGNLVAACLSDLMSDGISMVYSFFDPSEAARSLGRFMILDHIEIARAAGLPYVYLGYWVPGSTKMDYKSHFAPFEYFRAGQWRRLENAEDVPPEDIQTPDASPMLPE